MTAVNSRDGTEIAFDRVGRGAPVVLVDGALSHRKAGPNGPLALEAACGLDCRYFMTAGVGLPGIMVATMRLLPMWSKLKAVAHTLPYDATILGPDTGGGRPLPYDATILGPDTLVLDGGKSKDWTRNSNRALAELLGAEHRTLEGQRHMVKPRALAPVLTTYFGGKARSAAA